MDSPVKKKMLPRPFGPLLAYGALVVCLVVASGMAAGAENIRLNQIGFYRFGPKLAVIVSSNAWRFSVKSPDLSVTYYTGDIRPALNWAAANEVAAIADFSEFTRIGTYVVDVSGVGTSYPFRIDDAVHSDLTRGLLRAFYYQRASTNLPAQYAGRWARNAGHPDTKVIVHPSAASDTSVRSGRRTGDELSSPKGWYDAGDYGKYVVNAGISVYTLLSLYERFPGYCDSLSLNIPRTYGALPDVLSEVKWELDWLLTMQDPSDGGVYHKLTSLDFCGFIMPEDDRAGRYVIGKGSAATFDFAAVCATAYRIYKKYLPGFADSCLAAARYAWAWGSAHPNVRFRNPSDVLTGEYGDGYLQDERQWAAIELLLATGDTIFRQQAFSAALGAGVPSWPTVSTLGTYSLSYVRNDSMDKAKSLIKAQADVLATFVDGSPFHTVLYDQFYWGSNGLAANDGMLFIEAFLSTKNPKYFECAIHVLDYLVGRNAVGYSFVTGFGSVSPRHPHHRPSSADGIDDPEPGFLVGGPNAGRNDAASCNLVYPSAYPAKSWIDAECAYACNEVAINWNAPAAFLAGALEAIYADTSNHVQTYKHDTLPPGLSAIMVTGLGPDRASITWETDRDVSASAVYGTDSLLQNSIPVFSADARRHTVRLTGLHQSTPYFFRVSAIDAFGALSASALQSFTTSSSALLDGFSFNPSAFSVAPGASLPIAFAARPGLRAMLNYSKGGSSLVSRVAFTEVSATYAATIPGPSITAAGTLFSITLSDSVDSIATPLFSLVPSAPLECVDTVVYPKTYQMISLPLLYGSIKPAEFFKSQLGDQSAWRYYGYSSDSSAYTGTESLKTGRGGWLYSAQSKTIRVQGMAVKPDSMIAIPLARGWNIIGSPFTFPLYWENSLVRDGAAVLRIFDKYAGQIIRRQVFKYSDTSCDQLNNGWYGSNAEALFTIDTTRLLPWKGYWVYAEKNGVELLLNPVATAPRQVLAKKARPSAPDWRVRFSASSRGVLDNAAIIGASPNASDDYDDLDSPKPPAVSNEVSIGLLRPQWRSHGAVFAADIVAAPSTPSHCWRCVITTAHAGETVILAWKQSGTHGGYLYLYDSAVAAAVDLSRASSYTVAFAAGETRREFTIRQVPSADKNVTSLPTAWSLQQATPNPFKTSTTIDYRVPMMPSGDIGTRALVIAVYDALGRRVRTLVNTMVLPGRHSFVWNGTDDANRRLRQGVYIIHLSANGYASSVKTHIVD